MGIKEEFKVITGFDLQSRETNNLNDEVERKDYLFNHLAVLYCTEPQKFKKLKQKIRCWLKQEQSEATFALAGYFYYINEEPKKAKQHFLKTVSLNPDNLDNWLDLAFTLRQLGENKVSFGILFNYVYIIYYYKYLKLAGCDYPKLKRLILEILKRSDNA